MVKEVIKKTFGKKFTELTPEEKKRIVNQVKKIPEFAKKTTKEIKKILNKIFTQLPTRKYKKPKERKELFDVSDLGNKSTMVGRNTPKQQMTKVKAKPMGEDNVIGGEGSQKIITSDDLYIDKATGKIKESLKTGSKKVRRTETPVFDSGRSRNPFGMNKGGRVRSYRGYGKARRG
jgi:hypothetical protein